MIFALFYFVFEGKFQVQPPRGAHIRRGDLTEGFFTLRFWGAYTYTRRGLFSEFSWFLQELISGMHATTGKTSVFAGYSSKVPVTSFQEGKAKKAKPAKKMFLAHKPVNW